MPTQRSVKVTTALGDALTFHQMTGSEGISRPFAFELALVSDDMAIALEDVLGTPVAIEFELDEGAKRYFHGLVSDFAYVGTENEFARYQATLRPWIWFLARTADCRIFQNQTVVEIIKAIFEKYPIAEFEDRLHGQYAPRVYCVQYRESDFDFVNRLMESEGICYFFKHEEDKHTLVLADSPQAHESFQGYAEVPFFPRDDLARRERDHLYEWQVRSVVEPGTYVHTAFDFEKPKADLAAKLAQPMPHALSAGEIYDYPGPHLELGEGDRIARVRLEAAQVGHKRAFGAGTAAGLVSGYTFTLEQYPRADQNVEHLLLEVTHQLSEPTYRSGMSGDQELYLCSCEAMPTSVAFRPRRVTPKPIVQGPQTAMVTGPAGEELWTDKYGRVKVQFHWDREGKRDENSSCWIRVSHAWAGPGFGAVTIPRIGQEVIVDFIGGDPDAPIITGRVYNANAMPPFDLPGNAVVSGFKSNTHKGRGYNEITMDDTTSKEKITIHGQYDMNTTVEHDQTNTVKNDFTETITNNAKIEISKGTYNHDVKTGTAAYHVQAALTEKYDATQDTTVKNALTIKSTSGPITVSADSQHIYIHAATSIQLQTGSSMLWMASDGNISLEGVNITVNGSKQVTITGGVVHSEAQSEHQTKGAIVLSDGTSTNTVKGGMVMLNP